MDLVHLRTLRYCAETDAESEGPRCGWSRSRGLEFVVPYLTLLERKSKTQVRVSYRSSTSWKERAQSHQQATESTTNVCNLNLAVSFAELRDEAWVI